jgi:hypothetical protein
VDSGKHVQEVTLELVPDLARGGLGSMTVQLHDPQQIGILKPGMRVKVEVTEE